MRKIIFSIITSLMFYSVYSNAMDIDCSNARGASAKEICTHDFFKKDDNSESKAYLDSFNLPSIQYCNDLMSKVKDTNGTAPKCVPVIKKGMNLTEASGLVGLSSDLSSRHIFYYMTITPGQLNGQYSYIKNELDNLIRLMRLRSIG